MNPTKQDLTVATTILEQLGGSHFLAMTGARDVMGDATTLQFKLPRNFARDGINAVRVTLDESDTYTVAFFKVGRAPRFAVKTVAEVSGVYAEDLRALFTRTTGLEVSLGSCSPIPHC